MDLNLSNRLLPAPKRIEIISLKRAFQFLVTWDAVLNPDLQAQNEARYITTVGYHVYRGSTANGLFYRLTTTPTLETRYETTVDKNPNINYFYKISSVATYNDGSSTEGAPSHPVVFHVPNTNKWFDLINERNKWILKNTGVLMDLYVRKNEGPRCSCYNATYGQGEYNCPHCYGTTYEGGYDPVYQLWIREKPTTEQLDVQPQGLVINRQTGAWTITKTLIKNRDVIINPQGVIYAVINSNVNTVAGYYFHQELTIKEVDPTDILYTLERSALYPEF